MGHPTRTTSYDRAEGAPVTMVEPVTPTPAPVLQPEDIERITEAASHAYSGNTRRAYASAWARFPGMGGS